MPIPAGQISNSKFLQARLLWCYMREFCFFLFNKMLIFINKLTHVSTYQAAKEAQQVRILMLCLILEIWSVFVWVLSWPSFLFRSDQHFISIKQKGKIIFHLFTILDSFLWWCWYLVPSCSWWGLSDVFAVHESLLQPWDKTLGKCLH